MKNKENEQLQPLVESLMDLLVEVAKDDIVKFAWSQGSMDTELEEPASPLSEWIKFVRELTNED